MLLTFDLQALLLFSAAAVAMAQYGHGGYGGDAYGPHDYVSKTTIFFLCCLLYNVIENHKNYPEA